MTLRSLISNLEKPVVSGPLDTEITTLTYDSRQAGPGSAFFALRGVKADGHRFIQRALAAGCSAIFAETAPPEGCATPWVHVKSSRAALALAAATWYEQPGLKLKLAGITGTNGKTTIAFLLHYLLNTAQRRTGLLGTLYYDLGGAALEPATHTTPESLELQGYLATMAEAGCRAAVMEVSSHALDQQRVLGLPFEVGIFTNLTQDHLDYHKTMEAYYAAKVRLFETISHQDHGRMIINSDDSWGRKLITRYERTERVLTYGYGVHATFRAINVRYDQNGTTFELEFKGRSFLVRSPLIGDFNVHNTLAALAAAHAMGLNLRETVRHLQDAPQVPGRLERVSEVGKTQVFVDYAHTPDALKNVLQTLRELKPKRLITVFGCGGDRDSSKRPLMAAAAQDASDICVLTSDNPRTEDPQRILADAARGFTRGARAVQIEDRRTAIRTALENARDGDIVLIAGKGHEDYQEIQGVRHPFDDRRVARQLLSELRTQRAVDFSSDPPTR
ncbi:MAG: UDP-N-acetylmuramoyl-L-alanyl-D-glutamate--2,6-diaminopimelate ligase [Verrucomicrobiales bacterium]|nr:UDP-N-acetylmuramoyl-L-alanyl-D-glutamate--2,6-diaminopimelate ligase [Verrucomicrobiales bacterium]